MYGLCYNPGFMSTTRRFVNAPSDPGIIYQFMLILPLAWTIVVPYFFFYIDYKAWLRTCEVLSGFTPQFKSEIFVYMTIGLFTLCFD